MKTSYFGGGSGGGGGAVSSVFGRIGAVIAAAGDYAASLITNDSSVSGSSVKDALNTLGVAISSLVTGVSSVFGRVGNITAQAGDYTSSLISNASALAGTTVTAALNYLGGQAIATATGATPNLDFAASRYYVLTLNANCSPTMTVPPAGVKAILEVVQGSGPYTLTLPSNVDLQTVASGGGAISISTVSGVRNIFEFLSNGTRLRLIGVGEY